MASAEYKRLKTRVETVKRHWKSVRVAEGMLILLSLSFGYLCLSLALDNVFHFVTPVRVFLLALFSILMGGIVVRSGYRPFMSILLMGGRPGAHTGFVASFVGVNLTLNALLIPWLGAYGAGIATAMTCIYQAVFVRIASQRVFGVRL